MRVGIIDYGAGNTGSVMNAITRLGHKVVLSSEIHDLKLCSHIILPGVGSFSAAKKKLSATLSEQEIGELISGSRAFLGICVGMQLLCDSGSENEETPGYGFFSGQANLIPGALVLPHMGWNNLEVLDNLNPLLHGITNKEDFYFVHSYSLEGSQDTQVIATSNYGSNFPAVVQKDNVYGVQFHPEKSSGAGRKILENFLSL